MKGNEAIRRAKRVEENWGPSPQPGRLQLPKPSLTPPPCLGLRRAQGGGLYPELSVMFFDTFEVNFAKMTPKVSINDRFYKVFYELSWMLQNALGPMLFDILHSRKTPSTFTGNLLSFDHFGATLQKGSQKSQ